MAQASGGPITVMGSVTGALAHVSVTVTDVERARAFYGGVLGLPEVDRPDFGFPGIWYDLGRGLQLHIIVNEGLSRPAAERDGFDVRYPHFAIGVESADAAAAALRTRGVRMDELLNSVTGLRQLFVKDPDGNMVELIGPGGRP
ncbi:MAG: VOC family protein [Alphaproteobacteria bacterium]|nr:VOC family protein [Alphaproteobacteria bacterium]